MHRAIAVLAALATLSAAAWFTLRPSASERKRTLPAATASATPVRRVGPAHLRGPATTETQRYRFTYRVEAAVDDAPMPVMRVEGDWDATPTEDGYTVRLSAVSLDAHEALPAAASLESTFGLKAKNGVLAELGFDADADEATRRTFAAMASVFWLSAPANQDAMTWQVDEAEMTGVFAAEYSRDGDVITKRIGAYRGVRGPNGLDAKAARALKTDGEVRFEVDSQGVAKVIVDLNQVAQMDDDGIKVVTRTRATLERVESDRPAVVARGLRFGGFDGLVDYSGQGAEMDARKVGDADVRSLLRDLAALDALRGRDPAIQRRRAALLTTLSALIRLEPQAAGQLASALRERALRGENTSLLAGALASSESAAGTNALAGLIGDDALPRAARHNAINTLGLAHQATPESLDALSDQLDGELGAAAAMGLGSQAKRIAEEAPEEAKSAVEQLIEAYEMAQSVAEKATYLRALGNTGAREILPVMTAAIASNDPTLKPLAIRGLRFVPGDDVDAMIKPYVFTGTLFAPAALDAVQWRSPAVWSDALAQARATYTQMKATTDLVKTIDGILTRWNS